MTAPWTRRRFIAVSAAAAGLAAMPRGAAAKVAVRRWRGVALGADAELILHHPEPRRADEIIAACLAEVRRLEAVFSLYRPDSALARLNRHGKLATPPHELVELLGRARNISEASGGAFDVTIQPLWRLYSEHFGKSGHDPAGPGGEALAAAQETVGYQYLQIDPTEIAFRRPGMAVTLNGIAQGYITDRVAELLRQLQMTDILVHMGETRALGGHPDGRAWRIGLRHGGSKSDRPRQVDLRDAAIATSGGQGFIFDEDGRHHHILDPRTGASPARWRQISAIAREAAIADALSTTAMILPVDDLERLSRLYDTRLIGVNSDGTIVDIAGSKIGAS